MPRRALLREDPTFLGYVLTDTEGQERFPYSREYQILFLRRLPQAGQGPDAPRFLGPGDVLTKLFLAEGFHSVHSELYEGE